MDLLRKMRDGMMTTTVAVGSAARSVTAEPVQLLYMLGAFMQYSVFQDLVYREACEETYDATICANLSSHPHEQVEVQSRASYWILSSTVGMMVPAVPAAALLGAWGDSRGRRLPLAIPSLGAALGCLVLVAVALGLRPALPFIIIASAFAGASGGFASCIVATVSYVTAYAGPSARTGRVALIEAMTFTGGALGPLLTGIMLPHTSHADVFALIAALHVTAVIYVAFCLPAVPNFRDGPEEEIIDEQSTRHSPFSWWQFFHVWETCVKPRAPGKRTTLLSILFACFIIMTVAMGEMDVAFLLVREAPFDWSYERFADLLSLRAGLSALVLLVIAPLLLWSSRSSRHLLRDGSESNPLRDWILCLVGIVSRAGGLIMLGLANTDLEIWLFVFVASGSVISTPSLRSLLSQQVESHEIGKVLAALGTLESFSTLLGSVIFNSLYPAFLKHGQPGMTFITAAVFLIVPAILSMYCLIVALRARNASPQLQLLDDTEED